MQDYTTNSSHVQPELPILASIPQQLKLFPDWVTFEYEVADDTIKPQATSEPTTLQDAYELAFEAETPTGIAFKITESRPIVAIELVDAINSDTDTLKSWAADIYHQLESYTEAIDSTSLRIWIISHQTENLDLDNGHIRVIASDAITPITGDRYGTYADVASREAELSAIVSQYSRRTWLEIAQDSATGDSDTEHGLRVALEQCLNQEDIESEIEATGVFEFLAQCWQSDDLKGMIHKRVEDYTFWSRDRRQNFYKRIESRVPKAEKKPAKVATAEAVGGEPFEAMLQTTKNGDAKENYFNIVTILSKHSYWKKKLRYDSFKNTVIVEGQELDDALTGKIIQWFGQKNTYGFGGNAVQPFTRAIHDAAKEDSFDSLSEWILNLQKWDGIPRLRTWMIEFCGSPETELTEWISQVSIMQMIARGMRPGCKARLVPIWEGPQDKGKTSAIMALGDPWAMTFSISMDNKEAHMAIQGAWVAELDELDTMRKTTETRLKSFISQVQDSFVPKYLNFRVTYPRRTVFFGSTNDEKYLRDETGATRFLPIKTTDFDVDGLIAIREQLFSEARDILLTTPDIKWWEEPESIRSELNEEREKRRIQNIYVGDICKWLDGEQGADSIYRNKVTWREIAIEYLKVESPERWNSTPLQMSIYRAMRESGWYNKHTNTGNVWMRESESDASSADEVPF